MDLRFLDAAPSDDERAAVDALLGPPPSGWEGGRARDHDDRMARGGHDARSRRDLLLPALHALNDRVGWISDGGLNYVCRRLTVAPAEAYGVADFYDLFSFEARTGPVTHVCIDLACRLAGVAPEALTAPGAVASPCLGLCDRAPAALVTEAGDPPRHEVRAAPPVAVQGPVLLARVGVVDPTSLDDYRAHGGYEALRLALEMGPEAVVDAVTASGLAGRGGAAFPTGRKWRAVATNPVHPHELVANADESEPGTFKDRVLLEGDPFALVEAMTIAGIAIGAEVGRIYLRGEYHTAHERLASAIAQARHRGLLGESVLGHDVRFDLEIRRGAGAYICGEETAIFNSIEGYRGEPRNKPPFPSDAGLFGHPTAVNNIETLVAVLAVLRDGPEAFAAIGTEQSKGTKLFCLSGDVVRPGVLEAPFGVTVRELIAAAGGLRPGRSVQAVLLGGAAGSFLGPDDLDLELSMEATRAAGASLGSGVVMVVDDTADLVDLVGRIAEFFGHESCGQCVPCRVGTQRQREVLARLAAGTGDREADLALLRDLGRVMTDASICGLGQTANNAVASAVARLGVFS